jgi:hypothetical protein
MSVATAMLFVAGAARPPSLISNLSPQIDIVVDSMIAVSEPGSAFVEPFVAVDPTNPNRLVVTASQIDPAHGIRARVFVSADGGRRWASSALPELGPALDSGRLNSVLDLWAAVGDAGTMYVSAVATQSRSDRWVGDPWSPDPTFVFRSSDHGAHWSAPTVIRSRSSDAPKIAVFHDSVVVLVTEMASGDTVAGVPVQGSEHVVVFRSDDGGRSFGAPRFLAFDDLGHNPLNPVFLPDGSLLVGWFDHPHFGRTGQEQHIAGSRIFVARSSDGGRTFEIPHVVGDVQHAEFPAVLRMVVDDGRTSPRRGRVYVVWNGGTSSRSDVTLTYSDDGGRRWSKPAAVTGATGSDVFTAAAVAPDGTVGFSWAHHAQDAPLTPCYVLQFTASTDGGQSFANPVQLAPKPTCPDTPGNRAIAYPAYGGRTDTVATTWLHGGHYIGLAAGSDGVFHPVWTDTRDGPFRVYTARVRTK